MKPTDRYPNTSVISVYQSLWKNMLLVAVGLAWGVGGYFIFTDPSTDWPTKVAGGLLGQPSRQGVHCPQDSWA